MTATPRPGPTHLAVVMPAYGELPNLRELLPRLVDVAAMVPGLRLDVHPVLPVEASEAEVQELTALGAHPVRRGPTDSFGDAIRSGIAAADESAQFVIIMDADGSHSPETIPRLLEALGDADVAVASRYTHGGSSDNAFVLRLMSRLLNDSFRLILGIGCTDLSTNFKLYRRVDLAQIRLTCRDFDVVEEILFRLKQLHGGHLRIVEVPDRFHERRHGETKRRLGPFIVSYMTTLLRLRLHHGQGAS